VGDEDHSAVARGEQRRQAPQPVGVEMVRRLVEQHDVEARDVQGRESRSRRLSS
jgi:hypothetical protein